ncbi:paralemmin-3 [Mantella aurantiaca]
MGETQLYSQRLHGITEKRRILSEVEQTHRELEQQRVKLHQLKRKSLRDRWLMDGLVPAAGAEIENPLSETEGQIKELELQLESLQSELVYLENPELRALKGVQVQGVTLQKELVNGERNLKQVDQNENLRDHPITEEPDQPAESQGEKPAESQKDLPANTEEVSENHKAEPNTALQLSNENEPEDKKLPPSQNADGSIQIHGDGDHKSVSEEREIQNSGPNQDRKGEHEDEGGNPMDGETGDKAQSIPSQKLSSLENTLEQEDHHLRSPTNLESVGQKTDDSQPSSELNNDFLQLNQDGKESLLDEITKLVNLGHQEGDGQHNQDGDKPHLSTEQLNLESLSTPKNEENSQNLEDGKVSVLVGHGQGHTTDEELVLTLETERAHPVLSDTQEEAEKPLAVEVESPGGLNDGTLFHSEDHAPNSENTPSLVLPPIGQEIRTTLPCTDQVPSQSLLSGVQNQVQISQILVVSPSGHEQSSNSAQGPSASHQPGARESGSAAPESQPLLQKPQETDAHQGANTAETRDKSTPPKKKSCQCCVVM